MLIGHQRIWDFLTQSAQKEKLAHAYLFFGPEEVGKKTLALEFAKWLLCEDKKNNTACGVCRNCREIAQSRHPDVFLLAPRREEKKSVLKTYEIGVEEIRDFIHHLSLSPYRSAYKIAIVDEADWLSREAVNAFLKTLEEPSRQSLIFLITSDSKNILPTIVSRCQLLKFLPVPLAEMEKAKAEFKNMTVFNRALRLCAGRPGKLFKIAERPEILAEREKQTEIFKKILRSDLAWRFEWAREAVKDTVALSETLSLWLWRLRDRLLANNRCDAIVLEKDPLELKKGNQELVSMMRRISLARDLVSNASFDSRLILENLMLKI